MESKMHFECCNHNEGELNNENIVPNVVVQHYKDLNSHSTKC